jgi:hypothetical protein
MKLVQNHPSFLQDPLAAMKAHLEQVVALKEAASASLQSKGKKK